MMNLALFIALSIVVAPIAAYEDPFESIQERQLHHLINAARLDPKECVRYGYCGRRVRKLCEQCSLDEHFANGLYVGVAPVRKSRALSASGRAHLDALEQCKSPVMHNQPRVAPCDGSSSGVRINKVCKSEAGFGEVLSTGVDADPFFALDVFLCGEVTEQGCAPDARGLSSDTQREMLFNPSMPLCCGKHCEEYTDANGAPFCDGNGCRACTLDDPKLDFQTIGVGHHQRINGLHAFVVDFSMTRCDLSSAQLSTPFYSGTHLLHLERRGTTSFVAAFWPDDDSGVVEARVVVDGEDHAMLRQFPTSLVVRGHYAARLSHRHVESCRTYHFEFEHTRDNGARTLHRFPAVGELMTYGEGDCVEVYDELGIELVKRQSIGNNPLLEDVTVRANMTMTVLNRLERSDRSRRGNLLEQSIAQGESVNVTLVISHLGFKNVSAATAKNVPTEVRFRYRVNCTTPGSVSGVPSINDATLSDVRLSAFNGTSRVAVNASATDVGTFIAAGLGGTLTTRALFANWTNTLSFLVNTRTTIATGINRIVCNATALEILSATSSPINEPEFRNDTTFLNASAIASVERRVDVGVEVTQDKPKFIATSDSSENLVIQTVTVRNNGNITANGVVVGVRTKVADDVDESFDAVLVPDQREQGLFRWQVGSLAVGASRRASLYYRSEPSTADGIAVQTEAFVSEVVEKTIFILDDVDKANVVAERHVDFRVSHRLIARQGGKQDSADLTLFVENLGPSNAAVVTLVVVVAPPTHVKIESFSLTKGEVLTASAAELYDEKLNFPKTPFQYWVVGDLAVGEKHALNFKLVVDGERHAARGQLNVGVAVDRKRTRELVVLNEGDDYLVIKQMI